MGRQVIEQLFNLLTHLIIVAGFTTKIFVLVRLILVAKTEIERGIRVTAFFERLVALLRC